MLTYMKVRFQKSLSYKKRGPAKARPLFIKLHDLA